MPLKDASQEATRDSAAGEAGRCRIRGNPEPHWKAALEERRPGATRSFSADAAEGCEIQGDLNPIAGTAGRCRERGNPGTHRKALLEEQAQGRLGASPPVAPKDARFEATRRSIAGKA